MNGKTGSGKGYDLPCFEEKLETASRLQREKGERGNAVVRRSFKKVGKQMGTSVGMCQRWPWGGRREKTGMWRLRWGSKGELNILMKCRAPPCRGTGGTVKAQGGFYWLHALFQKWRNNSVQFPRG